MYTSGSAVGDEGAVRREDDGVARLGCAMMAVLLDVVAQSISDLLFFNP